MSQDSITPDIWYAPSVPRETVGRYSWLAGISEIQNLQYGDDFRKPEFRREVFLRFYEFCLKYRIHAGASMPYMTLPYLWDKLGWTDEQALWYTFINGNTQHPLTSLVIFNRFPDFASLDVEKLDKWYNAEWVRLEFDTDRRHQKRDFMKSVITYKDLTEGNQLAFFKSDLTRDQQQNFRNVWKVVRDDFYSFGRMSTYSYLEYLKILGIPLEPDSLFLEDIGGSKSLRNGLAKVLGRDDWDWWDGHSPYGFDGKYTPEMMKYLQDEGAQILKEARERFKGRDFIDDVTYFTLESEFCTYKGFHRPNRRYPGVYCDIFHGRIKKAEARWPEEDFSIFWKMRQDSLPKNLRLEDSLGDPGVKPVKQNHYRETGQIIMMDEEWSCFKNDFNDRISLS